MAGGHMGKKSRFDGVLAALWQCPPFQRLKMAVNGAEDKAVLVVHDYLVDRISKELWGDNLARWDKHIKSVKKAE